MTRRWSGSRSSRTPAARGSTGAATACCAATASTQRAGLRAATRATCARRTGSQAQSDGAPGGVIVNPGTDDEETHLGLISNVPLGPDCIIEARTSGAGGVGSPKERDRRKVVRDLRNGLISRQAAVDVYGLDPQIADNALVPGV